MNRAIAVLSICVAITLAGCGDDPSDQSFRTTGQEPDGAGGNAQQESEPEVDAEVGPEAVARFQQALTSIPGLRDANIGPASQDLVLAMADFRAVGRLVEARFGAIRNFGSDELVCQDGEGEVTESTSICIDERLGQTVAFDIVTDEVNGQDGAAVPNVGETLTIEIFVSYTFDDRLVEEGRAAIDALIESAPAGAQVVLYGINSPVGDFYQLAHPSGWAVVLPDGTLLSLAVEGPPTPGLGGVQSFAELASPTTDR